MDRAADARRDFAVLSLTRYPIRDLGDRIWALRDDLTACDACQGVSPQVALAEAPDCPLVTSDAKPAGAAGRFAQIEVYPPK